MNNIVKSTRRFEEWLGRQISIVEADLEAKHKAMASSPFIFLRGTFYRWAEVFPLVCEDLMDAPLVRGIGDLHIENFGTWRDSEGRLGWGVNDGDEACELPYTNDLTRLAGSARLAVVDEKLKVSKDDAVEYILEGYKAGMKAGGCPVVLAERNRRLRSMAMSNQRTPARFWKRMWEQTFTVQDIPDDAIVVLQDALPEHDEHAKILGRQAGVGSLGRQRFVIISRWRGGLIARECKSQVPSAWQYIHGQPLDVMVGDVFGKAVRIHDPFFHLKGDWIVRRLAPDCSKIDLTALSKHLDEKLLLRKMGWETANIHLGTPGAQPAILSDLKHRKKYWLEDAAQDMVKSVRADHKDWAKHMAA